MPTDIDILQLILRKLDEKFPGQEPVNYEKIAEIFAKAFKKEGILSSNNSPSAQDADSAGKSNNGQRSVVAEAMPVHIVSISDDVIKALSKFTGNAGKTGKQHTGLAEPISGPPSKFGFESPGLLEGLGKLGMLAGLFAALDWLANIDLPEGGYLEKIKGMMEGGGGILKIIGKLMAKGVWKKIFKSGSQVILKGIPGIGALFSFAFAYDRFKKGDTIGGVIDLVGGFLDIGTVLGGGPITAALSTGLDILNAYMDVKYGYGGDAEAGGKINFLKEMGMGIWNTLKPVLRYMPIIGACIRGYEAYEQFKAGDYGKGFASAAGVIGNIILSTGVGSPIGYAVMAGADFITSLIDAKDLQKEKAKTGVKMTFWQALKESIYDKIKQFVGTLPGWVRGAMKKIPGMSEFVGNIEADELKGLESMEQSGQMSGKERKQLDKLRNERRKKQKKLEVLEERFDKGDYGWLNTKGKRKGEIDSLRRDLDDAGKPKAPKDIPNLGPGPVTEDSLRKAGIIGENETVLEVKKTNENLRELIDVMKSKESGTTINSNSTNNNSAPRSRTITTDEFQQKAMQ